MNERIAKLYDQATILEGNGDYVAGELDPVKFAELIVRECIQVGGPKDSYTDEWFKAKVDSVNKIKQHFGVEE